MPDDLDVQKRILRAELRERRQNMPAQERELATVGLTTRLQELVESVGARSLSCYLSMPTEPNTRPFVNWAEARGIRVLFPVTREDGLLDWTVGEEETEVSGLHGMPEPEGELLGPMAINDVDLILVPAAAVDRTGMRLGWGRGFFDKTLGSMERCPPVYA
ncbi:MAG TPA: 5-formyltetrahydrofolate cyclo-ligase, partial [Agromyces sp.]|nr:5-formyltetrahydrofolate cyclo-ligase [Agromyces sp.]